MPGKKLSFLLKGEFYIDDSYRKIFENLNPLVKLLFVVKTKFWKSYGRLVEGVRRFWSIQSRVIY